MTITLGGLTPDNPVFLAPLSGITDMAFRRIARRLGAGLVVSEMIVGQELLAGSREGLRRAEYADDEAPVAIQLAGNEPRSMGDAARLAQDLGAQIIDINMGCPAKKVCNGYAGSALMREPELARRLVAATVEAVSVPVTLKMRLGWDDSSRNAPELARQAADLGIALVTVHGRTRCQFYKGRADWSAVARVREAIDLPLVVNGDIASTADARQAMARSGADAVMIGRACQGRPWLPGQIARELAGGAAEPAPDLAARRAIVLEHFEAMIDHHGVHLGVRCFRKHFAWYAEGLANAVTARARINAEDDPDRARDAIAHAFDEALDLAVAA